MRIRMTPRACETVDDLIYGRTTPHSIKAAATYIEGTPDDLMDLVEDLRTAALDVLVDSSAVRDLYERSVKNAIDARHRWANQIARAVRRERERTLTV